MARASLGVTSTGLALELDGAAALVAPPAGAELAAAAEVLPPPDPVPTVGEEFGDQPRG